MKRMFTLGLLLVPTVLMAQRKEDLQSIQRDVAQLEEQVRQLQRSQDEKTAALTALIQQAIDATGKLAPSFAALQQDINARFAEQQSKLAAPVAGLGTKVDQISDDQRATSTNVAELGRRLGALDLKLTEISNAIRTLSTPPPPPPTPVTAVPAGPPPGVTAESSYQNAFRDYSGGKPDIALQEFAEFLKYFNETSKAPEAQYYIGYIYLNNMQWEDAVKAFDAVEGYPENPKKPEALYQKGVALIKWEHRTEAGEVLKDFLARYPENEHAAQAKAHLRTLGLATRTPAQAQKKRKQ